MEKLEGNGGDVDDLEPPKGPEMEEDGGEGSFDDDDKSIVVHDPIVRLFRKPLGKKKEPRPLSGHYDAPQVAEEIAESGRVEEIEEPPPRPPPSKALAVVDDDGEAFAAMAREEGIQVGRGMEPAVSLQRLDLTPMAPMYESAKMKSAKSHFKLDVPPKAPPDTSPVTPHPESAEAHEYLAAKDIDDLDQAKKEIKRLRKKQPAPKDNDVVGTQLLKHDDVVGEEI